MKPLNGITFQWIFLTICALLQTASSFSPTKFDPHPLEALKVRSDTMLHMSLDRRTTISKITTGTFFGTIVSTMNPALVLAKTKEPVTKETIAKAFADVKFELEDPEGGIPKLQNAIESKDWENVKGFTKFYDLEFRKAKMVRTRKMFPDGEMRGETLQLCNNVTFDLIGINRASRAEDFDEALKYLEELKGDVKAFLSYEAKVVLP